MSGGRPGNTKVCKLAVIAEELGAGKDGEMKLASPSLLLLALVVPCFGGTIQIQTTVLPNGILRDAYTGLVTVTGGCAPFTWSVASGSLPTGINTKTSGNTGAFLLYGNPKTAASFTFTVSAKACNGTTAQRSYTVVIQSAANHIVDLSWVSSTTKDVVGYNIYRGADAKYWTKINSTLNGSTAYTDSAAANGTTYFYATTAVDVYGNESEKSNIVQTAIP